MLAGVFRKHSVTFPIHLIEPCVQWRRVCGWGDQYRLASVTLCVYVCVRALKGKRLELNVVYVGLILHGRISGATNIMLATTQRWVVFGDE